MLTYVGLKEPEELSQIGVIGEAYGISKNHLIKVVHELGLLGYLETVRGKNGGIRLAKQPDKINIGTLVRQTEKQLNAFDCYSPACVIVKACTIKGIFHEASQAYLRVLDSYSLADVLRGRKGLKQALSLS